MDTMLPPLLILVLLFINTADLLQQQQQHDHQVVVCKENERKALLDFRKGLDDPYGLVASWTGNNCCINWKGVQCSTQNGHVVRLDLHAEGPLHDNSGDPIHSQQLGGEIRPSLLGLRHLRYLNLSNNNFGGLGIPAFIGSLNRLRYLDLSCANFNGIIPYQLGNLTNLHYLDLSGSYYDNWWRLHAIGSYWLSNLSSLQYLNLNFVDLSEAPDMLHSLNTLQWISEMQLFSCKLKLPLSLPQVNFTSLYLLDLSDNSIDSAIPLWLFEISNLHYLYLGENQFSNLIPPVISNLTNLKCLDISYNYDFGVELPNTLGDLRMLKTLDLSGNNMSVELSKFGGILSRCINKSLETLTLSNAGLVGHLPGWLANLKSLKTLDLSSNSLYGTIHENQLPPSLQELYIHHNTLNGTLPKNISRLFPKLRRLSLGNNQLMGVLTETHFDGLSNIEYLDISSNQFVLNISSNWVPPHRLEGISMDGCRIGPSFPAWVQNLKNLSIISMSNAGISDAMPDWFWNFSSNLQKVDLSQNDIKGRLPHSLQHLQLITVDLSHNHFEGSLPCFPSTILVLSLKNNSFSDILPDCWNQTLQTLLLKMDLSYNNLTGNFPVSICANSSLQVLHLNSNNLSAELPLQLVSCEQLVVLDLGYNKFSGSISSMILDGLLYLEVLRLRSNLFSGNIPPQLGGCKFLRVIDLAHNRFSGDIPTTFGNLEAMKLSPNTSSGNLTDQIEVEMKGRQLWYYATISTLPVAIDLSSNNLSGEIPKELINLTGLQSLHLSKNHLTGKIPEGISELRRLESLDLSMNNLSGVIPESMTLLTSLSDLNLSFNELSGKIPSGGQFQTFIDPAIYSNNYNLCGFPLHIDCNKDGPSQSPIFQTDEDGDEDNESIWFCSSTGFGFAFGLLAFCGALLILLKRRCCFAYVQLLDDILDLIYVTMVVKFRKISLLIVKKIFS